MNRHSNRWVIPAFFMMILILLAPGAAYAGDAQQALQWLVSQQQADGAWHGADMSLNVRDTSEVTAALHLLRQVYGSNSPQAAALQASVEKGATYMLNVVAHVTGAAKQLSLSGSGMVG